ncbi:MAG: SIS domain-containing protein [Catenulispora sp.]
MSIETTLYERARGIAEALADPAELAVLCAVWGRQLAGSLGRGGRLLAAGNGGSAAQAQHLTAELVGRFRADRRPFSAIALHADTSTTTAIGNDYGPQEVFARQVEAHGRPGDIVLLMSTSGRSPNITAAGRRARSLGLDLWCMTGPGPNPLSGLSDRRLCVDSADTATIQEVHLVALHLMCEALDLALADGDRAAAGRDAGSELNDRAGRAAVR